MVSVDWVKCRRREKRKVASYQYQKDCCYFAQIAGGLKEAGAKELAELGAEDIRPEFSGIHFRADKSTLYRINYLTRLLSRCLAPLISFACHDTDTLYQKAKQIEWEDFFAKGNTFAVSGNVSDSAISHSKFAALRLKDAVADYFKEKTGPFGFYFTKFVFDFFFFLRRCIFELLFDFFDFLQKTVKFWVNRNECGQFLSFCRIFFRLSGEQSNFR